MISRFIDWLIRASEDKKKKLVIESSIFFIIIAPIIVIGAFSYWQAKKDFTASVFTRRESLAELAATVLKEKFDRSIDVGISFATRVQFRKLVEAGKWDEAIKILERAPTDFAYIDTVALFDPAGIVKTATPLTPPIRGVIGKSFAERDYYKGVSKDWQPYVSEVFKRAVEPKYNVVSIAIPIKSDVSPGSEEKILGILLLTIKLDTILDWAREIEVGAGGFVYFVDRNGHAAGHPKVSSLGDVVDFSEVPAVKKVLKGEKGVEIAFNPIEKEERLAAFSPVSTFGWGVVVQEPTYSAFAARDKNLNRLLIIYGLFFILDACLAYIIVRLGDTILVSRQNEKRFLGSIGDGVCVIDRSWNITLWNKAAEEISGWRSEEAAGKPLRSVMKLVREKDKSENITFIEEAMLYGKVGYMENNTLLITKDGREIQVGDSAAPVFDTSGKVVGAIIVFRDVSKEREADKMKEEFLFQIVHDLRAPATAIKLAAEEQHDAKFLEKHHEKLEESVRLIQEANAKMLTLINNLLEAARGNVKVSKKEAVDIGAVVQEILRELSPLAIKKGVKAKYSPAVSLPKILADREKLSEIFSNLIDNAIKYNKEGGSISITHEVAGDYLKTSVEDTGKGIPEKEMSGLFKPYFRSSTAKEIMGTGLGLYIVKKLVEEMGGKIEVSSKVGEGTTFTVSLPIASG